MRLLMLEEVDFTKKADSAFNPTSTFHPRPAPFPVTGIIGDKRCLLLEFIDCIKGANHAFSPRSDPASICLIALLSY